MLADIAEINIDEVIKAGPLPACQVLRRWMWIFVWIGLLTLTLAWCLGESMAHMWAAYFVDLTFFMGISVGSIIIAAIFQIVRAVWSPPVRRFAEANVAFLPWAWILLAFSWLGREELFPWARGPMPGKELWMEPCFVYGRVLAALGFLFYMMWRYVRMSCRADVGMLMERMQGNGMDQWRAQQGFLFNYLTKKWRGLDAEVKELQPKLSWNAPLIIALYAVIYSMFAFEMVMAMDKYWVSNLFGAFIFIGNIYVAWAVLAFVTSSVGQRNANYAKVLGNQQRWDMGKLTLAFCMLWGYLFFSQFLTQWYGNLPDETQWLILRMRDWNLPWIRLAWVVFPMCFILPFVLLQSRDVKRNPRAFKIVAAIIFIGIYLEKYLIIMPNVSPDHIPFNWVDIGLFLGFFGAYGLSIQSFLAKLPFVPISHPLSHGSNEW